MATKINLEDKEVFLKNKDELNYFKVNDNGVNRTYISQFTVYLQVDTW